MNYSYKGKILISTPDLSGDIFSRSVVLIVEHNEHGAFGFILNKKNKKVTESFKSFFDFDIEVYDGGPVENEKVFFIFKDPSFTEDYTTISEGFYLSEDIENIINGILNKTINPSEIKILSGYSGWSALQLESEIERKYWTVVDLYRMDYTQPNDQNLWKEIMQNLGGEFLLWANAPENITLN